MLPAGQFGAAARQPATQLPEAEHCLVSGHCVVSRHSTQRWSATWQYGVTGVAAQSGSPLQPAAQLPSLAQYIPVGQLSGALVHGARAMSASPPSTPARSSPPIPASGTSASVRSKQAATLARTSVSVHAEPTSAAPLASANAESSSTWCPAGTSSLIGCPAAATFDSDGGGAPSATRAPSQCALAS